MKIEYNNLYTHFILITQNRLTNIQEAIRTGIEKCIAWIVNNNQSKMYSIYGNSEHLHFLISRSKISEKVLATIVADSCANFIQVKQTMRWNICMAAISIWAFPIKDGCG